MALDKNKTSWRPSTKQPEMKHQKFPLDKINFVLMAVCCALIVIGFVLISGEGSGTTFNPEIFSTRRIVVGPAICIIGFVCMPIAIMWRGKKKDDQSDLNSEE